MYASSTIVNQTEFKSITYIGKKPTFNQTKIQIETHILDGFSEDIYDQKITVLIHHFIRGDQPFKNKDELIEQINKDILFISS